MPVVPDEHIPDNNEAGNIDIKIMYLDHNNIPNNTPATPNKDNKPQKKKWSKKFNPNEFKYQDLDLSVYGRHVFGFRMIFNEYLEDIEVYTKKVPDVNEYVLR